jgi:hypothetical protein
VIHLRTPHDLASHVRWVADEACNRIFPTQFPSVLRVRLENGEVREARISRNPGRRAGEPSEHRGAGGQVSYCTKRTLPTDRVEELRAALNVLDQLDSVDDVVWPLRAEQGE